MKKKTFNACIMAALLTAGIASTQATAGILAEGDISVYKGGTLSGTMIGKNPVDEEALLVCNGKCMIKSTGVSIIGATGTELSVKSDQEQFNLLLKEGQVDFILSGTVGKMGFYTADRQYASADVIYNASTASPVRGYMQVTSEGSTKIGVYDGRLVFNTVEGAKIVDSNNYIVLAQSGLGSGGVTAAETVAATETAVTTGGGIFAGIGTPALVTGTAVAAAAAWGVVEYANDDDDTPSSRIPRNPSSNR